MPPAMKPPKPQKIRALPLPGKARGSLLLAGTCQPYVSYMCVMKDPAISTSLSDGTVTVILTPYRADTATGPVAKAHYQTAPGATSRDLVDQGLLAALASYVTNRLGVRLDRTDVTDWRNHLTEPIPPFPKGQVVLGELPAEDSMPLSQEMSAPPVAPPAPAPAPTPTPAPRRQAAEYQPDVATAQFRSA